MSVPISSHSSSSGCWAFNCASVSAVKLFPWRYTSISRVLTRSPRPNCSPAKRVISSRCSGVGLPAGSSLWGGIPAGTSSSWSRFSPGSRQMAQVGRVEGAAVNSDFHSASFFFNAVLQSGDISDSKHTGSPPDFHRDRFFVGFTSWMRLSLGLLWLSRYSTNFVPMTWTTSARVAFASSSAAMRAS